MPTAVRSVTSDKYRAGIKFLIGQGTSPELTQRDQRQLSRLLVNSSPMDLERARTALKRLRWAQEQGNGKHEAEFLSGAGRQVEWEEAIFRNATHFNVFRLHRRKEAGTFPQRESTAYHTFPEAVAQAEDDHRALVYAVTAEGNNFCIPRGQGSRYQEIWSER